MATDTDRLLLQLDADVTRLNRQMAKAAGETSKALHAMESEAEGSMARLEALFGKTNVGEALENVFKRTRLTVFDEGAAKIPVFGSALEALGPAGLAAAAGLFAAFEGMEKVRAAAEEVGQLKVSADKLGIPVEDLQRWQFIAAQSHVSNEQLGQSFDGLSVTLGKLKSGIRDQRIRPFLDELGISDADIAKAHNAADLMDLLIDKMGKIQDPGERAQIADAFGMGSALPLLMRTRAEVQGMTDDYHANADVISGEQAEALEKQEQALNRAHALMHDKIRADLIALAPLVGGLSLAWDGVADAALGALADMMRAGSYKPGQGAPAQSSALGVAGSAVHVAGRAFGGPLGGDAADFISSVFDHLAGQRAPRLSEPPPHGGAPNVGSGEVTRAQMERGAKATDDFNKAMAEFVTHTSHAAEMQKRIAEDRKNGATITPQQEAQLMGSARAQDAKFGEGAAKKAQAAAQKALEENKASDDAISSAKKEELKARIALTADLLADHNLKLAELKEEQGRKDRQVTQDAAMGKISATAAATAIGSNKGAYDAGVQLENRRFGEAAADQARTYAADLARYQAAHLTASAEIATTAEAWAADTKAAFALQQQADKAEFLDKTNKRVTSLGPDHLTPDQAKAEISNFDAGQADQAVKSTRDADLEVLSRKRAFADQLTGYTTATLEAEAEIATSTAAQQAIARRVLAIRQGQESQALEDQIREKHLSPTDAAQARSDQAAEHAAQNADLANQQLSPWDQWMQEGVKAGNDVGEALQSGAVKGMDQVNSGISEAIVNGKNMGDVFKSIFRQMEADAMNYLLRQAEVGMFGAGGLGGLLGGGAVAGANYNIDTTGLSAIDSMVMPAFAGGTDDTPGGRTIYNEKGTEGYVPPGAQIIPNNTLRGLAKLDPSKMGGGSATMNHNISINLTGANGDETIRQIAHQAAAAGTLQAISYSNSKLQSVQRAPSRNLTRY